MSKSKGFTLIELLVVIAIIGILSSIVLASLNTARARASNAAVKGSLAQFRSQAELVLGAPNDYSAVCNATAANMDATEYTILTQAGNAAGVAAGCGGSTNEWAAWSSLKTPEQVTISGTAYQVAWICYDSTGAVHGYTSAVTKPTLWTSTACPTGTPANGYVY